MKEIKVHNKELQFEQKMNAIVSTCFKAINSSLITFIISISYVIAIATTTEEVSIFGMIIIAVSLITITIAVVIGSIFDKKEYSQEQERKYRKWLM